MEKLNKYIVPVNMIVYGETEADALDYVQNALDMSDLLDQDGIVARDTLIVMRNEPLCNSYVLDNLQ